MTALELLESLYAELVNAPPSRVPYDLGYDAGMKTALNAVRRLNESQPVVSSDGLDPFGMPVNPPVIA